MPSPYEWVDPWAEIDRAERIEEHLRYIQDEHQANMRAAAHAFADVTFELRRRMEAAWDPLIQAKALQSPPPIILRRD